MSYCKSNKEMSSLYLGLNNSVSSQLKSQNFMQCSAYSVHCTVHSCWGYRGCVLNSVTQASNRQNTASPKYNDDISFVDLTVPHQGASSPRKLRVLGILIHIVSFEFQERLIVGTSLKKTSFLVHPYIHKKILSSLQLVMAVTPGRIRTLFDGETRRLAGFP